MRERTKYSNETLRPICYMAIIPNPMLDNLGQDLTPTSANDVDGYDPRIFSSHGRIDPNWQVLVEYECCFVPRASVQVDDNWDTRQWVLGCVVQSFPDQNRVHYFSSLSAEGVLRR
mmetsp:Transcript_19049/g.30798  ORF Transcript_19049/g.30798 Transcript_19049/m.30798 type:complete len:116 (+) Transcript_19049:44-391(+)